MKSQQNKRQYCKIQNVSRNKTAQAHRILRLVHSTITAKYTAPTLKNPQISMGIHPNHITANFVTELRGIGRYILRKIFFRNDYKAIVKYYAEG